MAIFTWERVEAWVGWGYGQYPIATAHAQRGREFAQTIYDQHQSAVLAVVIGGVTLVSPTWFAAANSAIWVYLGNEAYNKVVAENQKLKKRLEGRNVAEALEEVTLQLETVKKLLEPKPQQAASPVMMSDAGKGASGLRKPVASKRKLLATKASVSDGERVEEDGKAAPKAKRHKL